MQAAVLPDGLEQMQLVEQAVRLAEKAQDLDLEFQLQLSLAQASFNCGQLEKTIVAIAWCFGMQDRHPDRFCNESLLNMCTYAMNSLSSLPTTPRERIAQLLDNVEQRYLEAGLSLRSIYRARCFNALWMGDRDEAERNFRQMQDCSHDTTYEGETWSRLFECDYAIQRGEFERAYRLGLPILEQEMESQGAYAWLASFMLLPLLKLGLPEEARRAQRNSVDDVLTNPSFAECVAHQVLFLVVVDDTQQAVELLDACLTWAFDAPLLRESFELALAAWACVRRLRCDDQTRWPGNLPKQLQARLGGGDLEIMERELQQFTQQSAERFDRRNGNRHYHRMIVERLEVASV